MANILRKNKSVVETNHVSAVRTGNIKAQYPMAASVTGQELQNGMAVVADDVTRTVLLPTAGKTIYLHVSEEQVYEEHLGRNSFSVKAPKLPKCLKLEVGDIFETNAVTLDAAVTLGTAVYPGTDGFWTATVMATTLSGKVVALVTLPNGEPGVKIAITGISV